MLCPWFTQKTQDLSVQHAPRRIRLCNLREYLFNALFHIPVSRGECHQSLMLNNTHLHKTAHFCRVIRIQYFTWELDTRHSKKEVDIINYINETLAEYKLLLLLLLLLLLFKAVLTQCLRIIKYDQNTTEHLAWPIGNGDPMHGVWFPHRIPRAWEQQVWNKRKK